ncbi:hypothetical protein MKK58_15710 [Methylobacterium sp. J-078]|uniref:hypothetical protein n=1 Tax=unclassified Methylobacterium TaxID=2615210 RepID=UPI001FB8C0BE|nr:MULTISPECIES: hypothetical protein [unclassified Methylobacterium]MBY0259738.1 hypothetical protein [Methylobacterium sp.]MCJ2045969.1 hypothetical protein [Methylobacterium sp. J-078]
MTRTHLAAALALTVSLAAPAAAQTLAPTGGAGNTGVAAPASGPGTTPRDTDAGLRPAPSVPGNPSPAAVPGSTPGVNIGGTPTSGPPGTGGAAGGPSIGR